MPPDRSLARTKLLAVLVAIQDEPSNEGRDIIAIARAAASSEELTDYVLAHFKRLPEDEKLRILEVTRLIMD